MPRFVKPPPISGELGKEKGTPSPKIVGLDQTGPIDLSTTR